jgi:hypothetical protein
VNGTLYGEVRRAGYLFGVIEAATVGEFHSARFPPFPQDLDRDAVVIGAYQVAGDEGVVNFPRGEVYGLTEF